MSIGVFCPVSRQEYPLLQFTLRPFIKSVAAKCILILHTGRSPHPDFGSVASTSSCVVELHRDFGESYEESVENGGYDQFSARNFAIEYIEKTGVEWIVQFDADQYLTERAVSIIADTSDRYDVIVFPYYTLISKTEFWYEPRIKRVINGSALIDPHLLIWRRALEKRNELCSRSAELHANQTRHCSVSFLNHPRWRIRVVHEFSHFHLHCLLGKKNSSLRRQGLKFGEPLPEDMLFCLEQLDAAKLTRS